eukprot:4717507-Amphidinium_carterae.1
MSPSQTSEQQAMIQDYSAVTGQSQSPRAGRDQPYSTTHAAKPQTLAMEGPPLHDYMPSQKSQCEVHRTMIR